MTLQLQPVAAGPLEGYVRIEFKDGLPPLAIPVRGNVEPEGAP